MFIVWLKGEVVTRKSGEVVDRASIAEHILQLAELGQFTSKNRLVPGIRIEEPQKLGQQIMPLERDPTGDGQT